MAEDDADVLVVPGEEHLVSGVGKSVLAVKGGSLTFMLHLAGPSIPGMWCPSCPSMAWAWAEWSWAEWSIGSIEERWEGVFDRW